MAGKDFRLTAVLAIRDVASPVVKAFSARWVGLAKVIQSTKFTGLQKQLRLFNRSVMDVAENAKNLGSIVGGPLAAAAGSVGFSMQQAVSSFTATGDGLDKMSQRVGVGVERLQEWGYAAVQAGASQETLEDALKDFGKHMTEIATGMDTTSKAATLFDALGIKMKDAAGNMRSVEDVFRDFADAIQRNEDPTLRASMAMAVFGEGGRKLLPMLTAGAAGLDDMSAEAHRLGIVMSRDAVKSASDLSTGFTNLHLVVASVGNTIASSLAPTITHMTGRIQTMIVANREAFSEKFAQVAERFAQSLESIDFEGIVSGILAFADYAIRAFNAVGGFNTVLYTMGAIMAGKTDYGCRRSRLECDDDDSDIQHACDYRPHSRGHYGWCTRPRRLRDQRRCNCCGACDRELGSHLASNQGRCSGLCRFCRRSMGSSHRPIWGSRFFDTFNG